jgi:hypothetical protein
MQKSNLHLKPHLRLLPTVANAMVAVFVGEEVFVLSWLCHRTSGCEMPIRI